MLPRLEITPTGPPFPPVFCIEDAVSRLRKRRILINRRGLVVWRYGSRNNKDRWPQFSADTEAPKHRVITRCYEFESRGARTIVGQRPYGLRRLETKGSSNSRLYNHDVRLVQTQYRIAIGLG